ncbi:hypothetical protein ACW0US_18060 [Xanthomonas euvesicatoria]
MGRLRAIGVGLGGGVIIAAGLTAAMDAEAVYCCDPWGPVGNQAFIAMGNTIVSSITEATTAVVQEMQVGLMQSWSGGFASWAQEIGKQTASQKTLSEGAIASKEALYAQDKVGAAKANAVEPALFDETITSAAMLADQDQTPRKALRAYGQQVVQDMYLSPYQSAMHQISDRHKRWCTDEEAAAKQCDEAAAPGMQMADADVASVLEPLSGKTYSDEGRDAALDYVRIIIASESIRAPSNYASPQAQILDGMTLSDQAALGAAANSFNGMMADRTRRNETETTQ